MSEESSMALIMVVLILFCLVGIWYIIDNFCWVKEMKKAYKVRPMHTAPTTGENFLIIYTDMQGNKFISQGYYLNSKAVGIGGFYKANGAPIANPIGWLPLPNPKFLTEP